MERIRVLVVDDSAFMRKIVRSLLEQDPLIEVVGVARDGLDALNQAKALRPHVMTLDVEMPKMDGLQVLSQLMAEMPIPVVMVSSLTQEGASTTLEALSLGAVEFVPKPSGSISLDMDQVAEELKRKVKWAARAKPRVRGLVPAPVEVREVAPGNAFNRLVVIGSSTGGPGALMEVIPSLPSPLGAAVLVVQHMPPGFTKSLAQRLDKTSKLRVKEAEEADAVLEDHVYVAPGGQHMCLDRRGRIRLNQDPPVHGVRPAVDVTLESLARDFGHRTLGVIMTGMGYDGARGIKAIKEAGGLSIAEDASTCVVYGMPRAVVEMNLADRVLPQPEIAPAVKEMLERWRPVTSGL